MLAFSSMPDTLTGEEVILLCSWLRRIFEKFSGEVKKGQGRFT